jgi:hypothetical protein
MDNTSAPVPATGFGHSESGAAEAPAGDGEDGARVGSHPSDFGLACHRGSVIFILEGPFRSRGTRRVPGRRPGRGEWSGVMRGEKNQGNTATALRFTAALVVFAHLAALACLATHHHANPKDSAPCLVCAGATAPAAQIEHAPVPAPPAAPAGPAICSDESSDTYLLPYSFGIRAPPAS